MGSVQAALFDGIALSVTQQDLFEHALNDVAFGASLYANIALAGFALLLFAFMARNVSDPRSQLIVVSVMAISAVSIASYSGLASGLTISIIEMPDGHTLAGATTELAHSGEEVDGTVALWGRYLTWTFSTPFILLALGLIAGSNLTKIFTAIVFDVLIMVTGLAAALTTSSHLMRWWWYAISCVFFAVVLYILLVEWPEDAKAAGTSSIFRQGQILTVVTWLGYAVFWAAGNEGLGVFETAVVTSWGYSILDIFSKYILGFIIIAWVIENEDLVSGGQTYGATSEAIPADD